MPPHQRALVVEDEEPIREILRLHLELAGFGVEEVSDGRLALQQLRATPFDLIVLDVMLPGLDGVTLCRAIRDDSINADTPILMLTARDGEADKVLGLESGADDYVTKPFAVRELLARVGALTRRHTRRRSAQAVAASLIRAGHLQLHREHREVRVRGELVPMTKHEFDLLLHLAAHPEIVFSRATLLRQVWPEDTYVTQRTVDVVISRLRRKIESGAHEPRMILTAWGVGYKFSGGGSNGCTSSQALDRTGALTT
jgi:DNA-binding response OmpR family regulator